MYPARSASILKSAGVPVPWLIQRFVREVFVQPGSGSGKTPGDCVIGGRLSMVEAACAGWASNRPRTRASQRMITPQSSCGGILHKKLVVPNQRIDYLQVLWIDAISCMFTKDRPTAPPAVDTRDPPPV